MAISDGTMDLSPSLPVLDAFYSLIASSLLPDPADNVSFSITEADVFSLALCVLFSCLLMPLIFPNCLLPILRLSLIWMCQSGGLLWIENDRAFWIWALLRKLTCLLVRKLWA